MTLVRPNVHQRGDVRRGHGAWTAAVLERWQEPHRLVLRLRPPQGHLGRHHPLPLGDQLALGTDAVAVPTPSLVAPDQHAEPVVPTAGALGSPRRRIGAGAVDSRGIGVEAARSWCDGVVVVVVVRCRVVSVHGDAMERGRAVSGDAMGRRGALLWRTACAAAGAERWRLARWGEDDATSFSNGARKADVGRGGVTWLGRWPRRRRRLEADGRRCPPTPPRKRWCWRRGGGIRENIRDISMWRRGRRQ